VNRLALLLVAACCAAGFAPSVARAGLTYFQVAETPGATAHGDSFVVGIGAAADVAHARDLIARGPEAAGAPILFADVAPGADGINRDLFAPGRPAWDWHVTNVTGFGDVGIELLDGWPTFVNADVDGWMRNTGGPGGDGGKIGFWSYTVVKELPGYAGGGGTPPAVPLPPAAWAGGATMAAMAAWRWLAARRAV
jgi:hypothetical protein